MSWLGCQINQIDVNFHPQKSLEIFVRNSADKIWSKKDKRWKVTFLMPIKVMGFFIMKEIYRFIWHLKKKYIFIDSVFFYSIQSYTKIALIVCIVASINPFNFTGMETPPVVAWAMENKFYAAMMIFFLR